MNMNRYVADTMALILRLEKRRMPENVKETFRRAEREEVEIDIPAIVFAELGYLAEKKRIETTLAEAKTYLATFPSIKEKPMTLSTVKEAFEIDDIPELHDRLIAATGKELNIPILTNDPDIQNSSFVKSIWQHQNTQ